MLEIQWIGHSANIFAPSSHHYEAGHFLLETMNLYNAKKGAKHDYSLDCMRS